MLENDIGKILEGTLSSIADDRLKVMYTGISSRHIPLA